MLDDAALQILKDDLLAEMPKLERYLEVAHYCGTDFLTSRKLVDSHNCYPHYFETLKGLLDDKKISHALALAHLEVVRKIPLTNSQMKKAFKFFLRDPTKPRKFPKNFEKSSEEEIHPRPKEFLAEAVPIPVVSEVVEAAPEPVVSEPPQSFEAEIFAAPAEFSSAPQVQEEALQEFENESPALVEASDFHSEKVPQRVGPSGAVYAVSVGKVEENPTILEKLEEDFPEMPSENF